MPRLEELQLEYKEEREGGTGRLSPLPSLRRAGGGSVENHLESSFSVIPHPGVPAPDDALNLSMGGGPSSGSLVGDPGPRLPSFSPYVPDKTGSGTFSAGGSGRVRFRGARPSQSSAKLVPAGPSRRRQFVARSPAPFPSLVPVPRLSPALTSLQAQEEGPSRRPPHTRRQHHRQIQALPYFTSPPLQSFTCTHFAAARYSPSVSCSSSK